MGYNSTSQSQFSQSNYCSTQPTKTTWYRKLLGSTTYASTLTPANPYKPKKTWWSRVKDWGRSAWNNFKTHPNRTVLNHAWNIAKRLPPIAIGRGIGWLGKRWYNEFKEQDSREHKIRYALDQTGDTLGMISGGLYLTGIGTPAALALDVVGGVLDFGAAVMYAKDKNWKLAGWKTLSIIPGIGSATAFVRQGFKAGKIGVTVTKETKALAEAREFYAPFAKVSRHIVKAREAGRSLKSFKEIPDGFGVVNDAGIAKSIGLSEWRKVNKYLNRSKSVLFHNPKTKQTILSPAGTNPSSIKDWTANIMNWAGFKSPQHDAAIKLANLIQNQEDFLKALKIAGHSKGGGIGRLIGKITGVDTYIFNPAGLRNAVLKKAKVHGVSEKNIYAYVNKWDALNATQIRVDSLFSRISPNPANKVIIFGEEMPRTFTIQAKIAQLLKGIVAHGKF